ncbi:MAG TPA: malto-oligosyltrehalose synthase [Methylomirabilota bacterium]|nr:malto-oligosyltrehalose synthase [Methylomirabilota bacterium]
MTSRALPESTYRLQFHAGFTFRDAVRVIPYLRRLGVTHCYASPYLKARPGSTHGYDIVDHNALNPEIGTEEDYAAFVGALHEHDLGQILDMVPNHMGVNSNDNAWWNDVLENGPSSRFAGHFDIAWNAAPRPQLLGKVLLPVLGEPYGDALEGGRLRLVFEDGAFAIAYHDRRFPLAPRSYARVLERGHDELAAVLGAESPALAEYQSILTAIRNLPHRTEVDPARVAERAREKEIVKRRLAGLAGEQPAVREVLARVLAELNGRAQDPASFDQLDDLLGHQAYRLSHWRVATDEINYRRFFDINDLAALRMERPEVFEATHALVLRLIAAGAVDGLRIDHPDGLYDPAQYFRRLRERAPVYVVAEKILGPGEALPESWSVHGTSGYDFLNAVNGLFVDGANADAFTSLHAALTGEDQPFAEIAYQKKALIVNVSLASELSMLTHQLDALAQKSRASRDFTFNSLREALREVIACFPVYRSYIADDGVREVDRRHVEMAVRRAAIRNPLMGLRVLRFIRDMVLLQAPPSFTAEDRVEQRRFAGSFQQVTAPVMAKGVEDTAFYVYTRLVSLNEVGGDPGRFGVTPEALHLYCLDRQARWGHALSPLSTHDTKRSEDVRARLDVLSEIPDDWRNAVSRWMNQNAPHRGRVDDQLVPDAGAQYLFYQTLMGAWPLEPLLPEARARFVARIQAYMEKALHEAKLHTSWINPNEPYDAAVREFVARTLDPRVSDAFLEDFGALQRRVSHYGIFNSLSQTVLRLACPGAPDTYQGTEVWDLSLVDPDNRRPVDHARLAAMLEALERAASAPGHGPGKLARELATAREDGRIKLYVTARVLGCRRTHPGLFSAGGYVPLGGAGEKSAHCFAFSRQSGEIWAVVAVPRLLTRLAPSPPQAPLGPEVWGDTRVDVSALPDLHWENLFTGERLSASTRGEQRALAAADLFRDFPVAVLLAHSR